MAAGDLPDQEGGDTQRQRTDENIAEQHLIAESDVGREDFLGRQADIHDQRIFADAAVADDAFDTIGRVSDGVVSHRFGAYPLEQFRIRDRLPDRPVAGREAGADDTVQPDQSDRAMLAQRKRVIEIGEVIGVEAEDDRAGETPVRTFQPAAELQAPAAAGLGPDRLADEQADIGAVPLHDEVIPVADIMTGGADIVQHNRAIRVGNTQHRGFRLQQQIAMRHPVVQIETIRVLAVVARDV